VSESNLKTKRKLRGEWHVSVWRQEDCRDSTTWPLPGGQFWSGLREKLSNAVYLDGATITRDEAMALRSLVHAYGNLLHQPKWRLKALEQTLDELHETEEAF